MIFLYIIVLIAAVLFYIMFPKSVAVVFLLFLTLLPVVLFALTIYASRKISAKLKIDASLGNAGQNIPMKISVTNPSVIPIGCAEVVLETSVSSSGKPERVRISMPSFPQNTEILSTQFSSGHFGIVSIKILRVKVFDMLRLWRFRIPAKNIANTERPVLVLPEPIYLDCPVSDYSESGLESDVYSDTRPGDDPSEIFSIRDYADGDRMSRIHWKLTAKQDKLMVKDYSLPICDGCLLIADTYVPPYAEDSSKLYDAVIVTVVSLSAHMLENGLRHRLLCYDEHTNELHELPVYSDEDHAAAVEKLLACGPAREKSQALKASFQRGESGLRFGHVILAAAQADENSLNMLSVSGLANRYSLLLCRNDIGSTPGSDFAVSVPAAEAEIDIINVDTAQISTSLAELTI